MSLQPRNAYKWIKEGIGHYNAERYKECIDACERAIQIDPDCARAYHGKGLALAQQKRCEEALIAYQKASHLAPENAKIHADMAELFYNMGDYEKSGLSYKKAIQLDSQFEIVYGEKSKVLLDMALDKARKSRNPYLRALYTYDKVISAFREVLLFNPDDAIALAEIEKIQRERGLALVQDGRYKEAIEAFLEVSQLNPEDAKLHASLAELLYNMGDYEKSGLSYKRAIQLDSQFETVYGEKLKVLLDMALDKSITPYLHTPYTCNLAISAFREVLLFNPDDAIALTEIEKIQREVEDLRCYTGTLIYTDKHANSANINLRSEQSDEEVRIFFLETAKDIYAQTYEELTHKYFSRTADGWRISFTFPLPKTDFRVEVLRNKAVIAYGLYWINNGYLGQYAQSSINLTIAYEPAGKSIEGNSNKGKSSKGNSNKMYGNSVIYVPDRRGGRNRRVRRGS